jgi:hypothetical protein
MKIKTVVVAAILSAVGMAGLMLAHAQVTATSIQPAPADDIVQVTADEANLIRMSSVGLPRASTYWVILPGYRGNVNALPYPCLPDSLTNSPIYDITGNIFLVDATGGQVLTGGNPFGTRASSATIASALALQANTIENLILQVQGAAASPTINANDQPLGGGFSPSFSITNGMYLTIAPGGTNQLVVTVINDGDPVNYELWWTPVLANPAYPWKILAVGATGQTNFTVDASVYPTGFYQAIWDTNGIPIWEEADPNNPGAGILTITIDSPTNNAVLN